MGLFEGLLAVLTTVVSIVGPKIVKSQRDYLRAIRISAIAREALGLWRINSGKLLGASYADGDADDSAAGEVDHDVEPSCNSWEVDQAEFVALDRAREILHPDQVELLDRLVAHLGLG